MPKSVSNRGSGSAAEQPAINTAKQDEAFKSLLNKLNKIRQAQRSLFEECGEAEDEAGLYNNAYRSVIELQDLARHLKSIGKSFRFRKSESGNYDLDEIITQCKQKLKSLQEIARDRGLDTGVDNSTSVGTLSPVSSEAEGITGVHCSHSFLKAGASRGDRHEFSMGEKLKDLEFYMFRMQKKLNFLNSISRKGEAASEEAVAPEASDHDIISEISLRLKLFEQLGSEQKVTEVQESYKKYVDDWRKIAVVRDCFELKSYGNDAEYKRFATFVSESFGVDFQEKIINGNFSDLSLSETPPFELPELTELPGLTLAESSVYAELQESFKALLPRTASPSSDSGSDSPSINSSTAVASRRRSKSEMPPSSRVGLSRNNATSSSGTVVPAVSEFQQMYNQYLVNSKRTPPAFTQAPKKGEEEAASSADTSTESSGSVAQGGEPVGGSVITKGSGRSARSRSEIRMRNLGQFEREREAAQAAEKAAAQAKREAEEAAAQAKREAEEAAAQAKREAEEAAATKIQSSVRVKSAKEQLDSKKAAKAEAAQAEKEAAAEKAEEEAAQREVVAQEGSTYGTPSTLDTPSLSELEKVSPSPLGGALSEEDLEASCQLFLTMTEESVKDRAKKATDEAEQIFLQTEKLELSVQQIQIPAIDIGAQLIGLEELLRKLVKNADLANSLYQQEVKKAEAAKTKDGAYAKAKEVSDTLSSMAKKAYEESLKLVIYLKTEETYPVAVNLDEITSYLDVKLSELTSAQAASVKPFSVKDYEKTEFFTLAQIKDLEFYLFRVEQKYKFLTNLTEKVELEQAAKEARVVTAAPSSDEVSDALLDKIISETHLNFALFAKLQDEKKFEQTSIQYKKYVTSWRNFFINLDYLALDSFRAINPTGVDIFKDSLIEFSNQRFRDQLDSVLTVRDLTARDLTAPSKAPPKYDLPKDLAISAQNLEVAQALCSNLFPDDEIGSSFIQAEQTEAAQNIFELEKSKFKCQAIVEAMEEIVRSSKNTAELKAAGELKDKSNAKIKLLDKKLELLRDLNYVKAVVSQLPNGKDSQSAELNTRGSTLQSLPVASGTMQTKISEYRIKLATQRTLGDPLNAKSKTKFESNLKIVTSSVLELEKILLELSEGKGSSDLKKVSRLQERIEEKFQENQVILEDNKAIRRGELKVALSNRTRVKDVTDRQNFPSKRIKAKSSPSIPRATAAAAASSLSEEKGVVVSPTRASLLDTSSDGSDVLNEVFFQGNGTPPQSPPTLPEKERAERVASAKAEAKAAAEREAAAKAEREAAEREAAEREAAKKAAAEREAAEEEEAQRAAAAQAAAEEEAAQREAVAQAPSPSSANGLTEDSIEEHRNYMLIAREAKQASPPQTPGEHDKGFVEYPSESRLYNALIQADKKQKAKQDSLEKQQEILTEKLKIINEAISALTGFPGNWQYHDNRSPARRKNRPAKPESLDINEVFTNFAACFEDEGIHKDIEEIKKICVSDEYNVGEHASNVREIVTGIICNSLVVSEESELKIINLVTSIYAIIDRKKTISTEEKKQYLNDLKDYICCLKQYNHSSVYLSSPSSLSAAESPATSRTESLPSLEGEGSTHEAAGGASDALAPPPVFPTDSKAPHTQGFLRGDITTVNAGRRSKSKEYEGKNLTKAFDEVAQVQQAAGALTPSSSSIASREEQGETRNGVASSVGSCYSPKLTQQNTMRGTPGKEEKQERRKRKIFFWELFTETIGQEKVTVSPTPHKVSSAELPSSPQTPVRRPSSAVGGGGSASKTSATPIGKKAKDDFSADVKALNISLEEICNALGIEGQEFTTTEASQQLPDKINIDSFVRVTKELINKLCKNEEVFKAQYVNVITLLIDAYRLGVDTISSTPEMIKQIESLLVSTTLTTTAAQAAAQREAALEAAEGRAAGAEAARAAAAQAQVAELTAALEVEQAAAQEAEGRATAAAEQAEELEQALESLAAARAAAAKAEAEKAAAQESLVAAHALARESLVAEAARTAAAEGRAAGAEAAVRELQEAKQREAEARAEAVRVAEQATQAANDARAADVEAARAEAARATAAQREAEEQVRAVLAAADADRAAALQATLTAAEEREAAAEAVRVAEQATQAANDARAADVEAARAARVSELEKTNTAALAREAAQSAAARITALEAQVEADKAAQEKAQEAAADKAKELAAAKAAAEKNAGELEKAKAALKAADKTAAEQARAATQAAEDRAAAAVEAATARAEAAAMAQAESETRAAEAEAAEAKVAAEKTARELVAARTAAAKAEADKAAQEKAQEAAAKAAADKAKELADAKTELEEKKVENDGLKTQLAAEQARAAEAEKAAARANAAAERVSELEKTNTAALAREAAARAAATTEAARVSELEAKLAAELEKTKTAAAARAEAEKAAAARAATAADKAAAAPSTRAGASNPGTGLSEIPVKEQSTTRKGLFAVSLVGTASLVTLAVATGGMAFIAGAFVSGAFLLGSGSSLSNENSEETEIKRIKQEPYNLPIKAEDNLQQEVSRRGISSGRQGRGS